MGLGSKLPCASTDACFSSVAPRLTSTKSGGRAPAMAHRHDLAILKSSASYFYTQGTETDMSVYIIRLSGASQGKKKNVGKLKDRKLEKSAPSDRLSQTDK